MIQRTYSNDWQPTQPRLVSLTVFYYLPDYHHLINSFLFQTMDVLPEMPRVHQFLGYWKSNIDAVIKEVWVTPSGPTPNGWRNGRIMRLG